jgi:hypothetical protein
MALSTHNPILAHRLSHTSRHMGHVPTRPTPSWTPLHRGNRPLTRTCGLHPHRRKVITHPMFSSCTQPLSPRSNGCLEASRKGTSQSSHVWSKSRSQVLTNGTTAILQHHICCVRVYTRTVKTEVFTDTCPLPPSQPRLAPENLTGTNVGRSMTKHKGQPLTD